MLMHLLLFLPCICALKVESSPDHSASIDSDHVLFVFQDQLKALANETQVLLKLYNQSIIQSADVNDIRDFDEYKSTNVTSLDKRAYNSTVDPEVRAHLHKVYRHLLFMIATAGAGVASLSFGLAPLIISAPILFSLLFLLSTIGFMFSSHKLFFSLSTSFMSGLMVGILSLSPIIMAAMPLALGGTALIFLTFTITALLAPSDTFLKWGGTLLSAMLATMLVSLFSIFFPFLLSSAFNTAMTWISLVLFSVFVGYDTQKMIEKAKFGITDYISDAYGLFSDLLNILMQLLDLTARSKSKE